MNTDPATPLGAPKLPAEAALSVPEPAAKPALGAANPSTNAVLATPSAATAAQPDSIANSISEPLPSIYLDRNLSYLDLSRPISTEKFFPLGTRPGSTKPFSYPFAAPKQAAALQSPLPGQPAAPRNPQLSAVNRTVPQLNAANRSSRFFYLWGSPVLVGRGATPLRLNSTSVRPNSTKLGQIQ